MGAPSRSTEPLREKVLGGRPVPPDRLIYGKKGANGDLMETYY